MGKIGIGLNLEAVRTSHRLFEWVVEFAAKLGYQYIEPMDHWGDGAVERSSIFP
jgi:hypothetical protein